MHLLDNGKSAGSRSTYRDIAIGRGAGRLVGNLSEQQVMASELRRICICWGMHRVCKDRAGPLLPKMEVQTPEKFVPQAAERGVQEKREERGSDRPGLDWVGLGWGV